MTSHTAAAEAPSKFVRVKCSDCGGEQVLFLRAATKVACNTCSASLAEPTGGLAEIKGEVLGPVE